MRRVGTDVIGLDRHIWDLDPRKVMPIRKVRSPPPRPRPETHKTKQYQLIGQYTYVYASGLLKTSVLCFYRRITSATVTRAYRLIVLCAIAFTVAQIAAFTIAMSLTCRPFSSYWRRFDTVWLLTHTYHCAPEGPEALAVNLVSAIQDFVAVVLPLVLVSRLRIEGARKGVLMGLFGLGFLVCAAGFVRVWYFYQMYFVTYDSTCRFLSRAAGGWGCALTRVLGIGCDLLIWTEIELLLAVICASLPALKVSLPHPVHPLVLVSSSWSRTEKIKGLFQKHHRQPLLRPQPARPGLGGQTAGRGALVGEVGYGESEQRRGGGV